MACADVATKLIIIRNTFWDIEHCRANSTTDMSQSSHAEGRPRRRAETEPLELFLTSDDPDAEVVSTDASFDGGNSDFSEDTLAGGSMCWSDLMDRETLDQPQIPIAPPGHFAIPSADFPDSASVVNAASLGMTSCCSGKYSVTSTPPGIFLQPMQYVAVVFA